ncbi:hypothetical protein GUJ93_ZPchr0012g21456 [Zizania palustris]|uniref:MADS-box domain-containing protein n=1 Tax=Zizania palustris TaxID=103762 RepID=A0A8J5WTD2_ZIZPA|nr:hypothetical protein GUJ93_ZPchr0012g21456 [Zizania palustris]
MGHRARCARTGDEHDFFHEAHLEDLDAMGALLPIATSHRWLTSSIPPRVGHHVVPRHYCLVIDLERRQVTFSKRRVGLFKKASELSMLCGAAVAVVAFSKADNAFAFGEPSVGAVLRRFDPLPGLYLLKLNT